MNRRSFFGRLFAGAVATVPVAVLAEQKPQPAQDKAMKELSKEIKLLTDATANNQLITIDRDLAAMGWTFSKEEVAARYGRPFPE